MIERKSEGEFRDPPRTAGLQLECTPVESWPRFGAATGRTTFAKRDDISLIGLGGNKVRKLDLILGQAIQDGVTDVVTVGGTQSNHCRLTAAAAARLGLVSHVFLRAEGQPARQGNVLLDHLLGAHVEFRDVQLFEELVPHVEERMNSLQLAGRNPLFVPLGGASPLGTMAYVLAVEELSKQLAASGSPVGTMVVAAGTGNTLAGITVGSAAFLPEVQVVGVSVSRTSAQLSDDVARQIEEVAPLLPFASTAQVPMIVDQFIGPGYTVPGPRTSEAVRLLARTEGVIADLTYTGKALEFLMSDESMTRIGTAPVVFWHTGGSPELFARHPEDVLATQHLEPQEPIRDRLE